MFGLLNKKPLIDQTTAAWLFDLYAWALRQFDAKLFFEHTPLVLPSNEFFPGRAESVDGMANLIFERVKHYAGLGHWPVRLADARLCPEFTPAAIAVAGPLRQADGTAPAEAAESLLVTYDAALVNDPGAMIAGFAHNLAHYLGQMANTPPPGGAENWPHVTEVLATFLGFGLMFANSAFKTPATGCGSCGGAKAERQSYLSQYDMTYALALFCVLKGIPNRQVLPHLKSSLRGFYKKTVREIEGRTEELERLRAIGRG